MQRRVKKSLQRLLMIDETKMRLLGRTSLGKRAQMTIRATAASTQQLTTCLETYRIHTDLDTLLTTVTHAFAAAFVALFIAALSAVTATLCRARFTTRPTVITTPCAVVTPFPAVIATSYDGLLVVTQAFRR